LVVFKAAGYPDVISPPATLPGSVSPANGSITGAKKAKREPATNMSHPTTVTDPTGWTSKPESLRAKQVWGDSPNSWVSVLRDAFGVQEPKPLLINLRDGSTYVLSGKLAKRDSHNNAIAGPGIDGFFLFNETVCEVRHMTSPVGMDKIWASLAGGAKDMRVEPVTPVGQVD
jgi:hypothetical protein